VALCGQKHFHVLGRRIEDAVLDPSAPTSGGHVQQCPLETVEKETYAGKLLGDMLG
jgi:hypothetical protein